MSRAAAPWSVVDLFSGAGGMSYGFHAHPRFRVIGAVDAQLGKPSTGRGTLGCNASYAANIGIRPLEADLAVADPLEVCRALGIGRGQGRPSWPPARPARASRGRWRSNHIRDDAATAWSAGSAATSRCCARRSW